VKARAAQSNFGGFFHGLYKRRDEGALQRAIVAVHFAAQTAVVAPHEQ